jgi:hypothetical protein
MLFYTVITKEKYVSRVELPQIRSTLHNTVLQHGLSKTQPMCHTTCNMCYFYVVRVSTLCLFAPCDARHCETFRISLIKIIA